MPGGGFQWSNVIHAADSSHGYCTHEGAKITAQTPNRLFTRPTRLQSIVTTSLLRDEMFFPPCRLSTAFKKPVPTRICGFGRQSAAPGGLTRPFKQGPHYLLGRPQPRHLQPFNLRVLLAGLFQPS